MVVRSRDGVTLVFNGPVFHIDNEPDLQGRLCTTPMGSAPGPRASRVAKLTLVNDAAAPRESPSQRGAVPLTGRATPTRRRVGREPPRTCPW